MGNIKIAHELEHEKKIIEMLGYDLIGPDNSNRWTIIENNSQRGFIQYKKLFNENNKKGYPKTFGYHMEIDSPKVSYQSTRKIANTDRNLSMDSKFSYELEIKRENGDTDYVDISANEYPSLELWSEEYGYIHFKVDDEGLYLNFRSQTENFNVEETVILKMAEENQSNYLKEYVYQIKYCDKKIPLSDDNLIGMTIREISGSSTPYQHAYQQINLSENTWINGKLRTSREREVSGTVEEMVVTHQMGIDSFSYFRFLINQILPFEQEVISSILSDEIIKKQGLSILISDIEKKDIKKTVQKKLKK